MLRFGGSRFLPLSFAFVITSVVQESIASEDISENSLIGTPVVHCGPEAIRVSADTQKPYQGVVYIRNSRRVEGCYQAFNESEAHAANSISLGIALSEVNRCGLQFTRAPGTDQVQIQGVWVFSFHALFETKLDKAFSVYCIFKQHSATVTTNFDVADLITKDTLYNVASPPTIQLKIVAGSILDESQSSIAVAKVGDPLTFIWYSSSSADTVYGFRVKDCFAETRRGSSVKIISDGCSFDENSISKLNYSESQTRAVANAWAFKFADEDDVWFKCFISTCVKNAFGNQANDTFSASKGNLCGLQPDCKTRTKRSEQQSAANARDSFRSELMQEDTIAQGRLTVIDNYSSDNSSGRQTTSRQLNQEIVVSKLDRTLSRHMICLQRPLFAFTSCAVILVLSTAVIAAIVLLIHSLRTKASKNG